jgi:hypothetical protein
MLKTILFNILIFILLIAFPSHLFADYIFMKDGTFKKGRIEERHENSIVFMSEGSQEKATIKADKIRRIVQKPLVYDKVMIHKNETTKAEGWLVDYDENGYTFRTDQNKDDEFHISMNEVLFFETAITPKNVTGKTTTTNIQLQWSEPETKVQSYKIYYKLKGTGLFQTAGDAKTTNYTITGLKGNTSVDIIVKSVTSEGFESLPGKALKISTLNSPPSKPGEIRTSIDKRIVSIYWKKSDDDDGSIKGYSIYHGNRTSKEKLENTNKLEFSYLINNPANRNQFTIRAIDDMEAESEPAITDEIYLHYFYISAGAEFVSPMGGFSNLYDAGWGMIISTSVNNYLLYGLTFGVEAGYYSLNSGKYFNNNDYNSITLIPFIIYGGYKINIFDRITLEPSVGIGYCYAAMDYINSKNKVKDSEITPYYKTGLRFLHQWGSISAVFGLFYSGILEKDKTWNLLIVNMGIGWMLY